MAHILDVLTDNFEQELFLSNWKQLDVGSSRRRDYNDGLLLYKRTRNLSDVMHTSNTNGGFSDDISKKSSIAAETNDGISHLFKQKEADFQENQPILAVNSDSECAGSFLPMGTPTPDVDPDPAAGAELRLSRFDDFQSLRALRSDEDSLVIGFDSEWYGDDTRKMLSWQFALIHGKQLVEYVFLKRYFADTPASDDLWLELALARILDDLRNPAYKRIRASDVVRYQYIYDIDAATGAFIEKTTTSWEIANNEGKYAYVNGKPTDILVSSIVNDISAFNFGAGDWSTCKRMLRNGALDEVHVTLVSHATKVDITTLYQKGAYRKEILRYLTEAGGGVFSMRPIYMNVNSVAPRGAWNYFYPIVLHIRDSICSAPADASSLAALGDVVGVPKLELPDGSKEHMDHVLTKTPALYMDYASRDAVIAMLYTSAVYGINKRQAVTILSAGTNVMKNSMAAYHGVDDTEDFDRIYRGLQVVKRGLVRNPDRAGFIEARSLDPLNRDAGNLQNDASQAYQGGYNSCSDVGYYDIETYDYDLQNAYPSAMCLVPDVDWDNCVLQQFEENHILTEQDFLKTDGSNNPFPLMFAYVRFEFPHGIKYPCLPVNIEGIPVFTRTMDECNGVFACGPELYLAVKLGAKVTVLAGYKVRPRYRCDGKVSFSMKHAVKQLVVDRREAKALCGKGSIEELILKLVVCGGYGKVAQNVKQKNRWSSYTGEMEDIGCSSITNPVSAAMITSIVRAVLLAAQNQITDAGYTVYSVTTDGFISNIPEDALKALDLYGLRDKLAEARLFLTDGADPEIWEIKHIQRDLLNLSTRGNISLNTGVQPKGLPGVCAHNGTKSGYPSDSYEDRLWLTTQSLGRTGPVEFSDTEWTPFKKLVAGEPFRVKSIRKRVRMDFDMKRKPVQSSIVTVYPVINGKQYEVANFTTEPFESPAEFQTYRAVKEKVCCLRTAEEWEVFFKKLSYHGTSAKPRDFEFSKLMSVIMGYRNKMFSIPYLDNPNLTVEEKCAWINRFNSSEKAFTASDWKNARRPDRVSSMLPQELLGSLIEKMQAASNTIWGHFQNNNGEWRVPAGFFNWIDALTSKLADAFLKAA